MKEEIQVLYHQIEEYASENSYTDTLKALSFVKETINQKSVREAVQNKYQSEFLHCLEVCKMLMDLHMAINPTEENALLAAVILHIYPENFQAENLESELVSQYEFDRLVYEIISTIVPERDMTSEEQQFFYRRVQENKLALLALLGDRGNIVQKLYQFSTWDAHRYIEETKACYYPMCIYGKEHYHELLAPLSVLMEKMKSLIEVTEILLRRYEVREAELIQDILALREENATIKGIIAKFRK